MTEPKQQVCVVTDSTSDIPREMATELGITVVPLTVSIEGEMFLDGDITLEEFFQRMNAAKELPKTSQPPVGAFVDAFREGLQRCSEVVCITISNKLSGTFESAMQAAQAVGDRVHILDSLNLSWGEGYQVIEAARAAAEGATVTEIKSRFEALRRNVHMVVGLDTLENLAKGGRIGRVSALLGSLLHLKVLFTVDEAGAFEPVARVRGTNAALQAGVDWIGGFIDETKRSRIAVQHALSPEKAAWLENAVRSRFKLAEVIVIPAGSVISTHTGTGWGLTAVQVD